MNNTTLEVNRSDFGQTRLVESDETVAEGEVLFRIDRFALTANNITYAVAGDMLGYWDFFPTESGWGRVPAMGWAEIIESTVAGIPVGSRYFGWFPMSQYAKLKANPTADGLRDDGDHRQHHAAVYRSYTSTIQDPWYESGQDAEDRHALLRGLFLTGFLADEFFADEQYFGAEQVIVLSASSKTAIGFAQRCAARQEAALVGVTSAGNADLVSSLGFYDQVVTYDDLAAIREVPSVIIDMSGNSGVVAAIHERFGDLIGYSMQIGMSHHDAAPAEVKGGPTPQLFFAPTEMARRLEEWGSATYGARTTEALTDFVADSRRWLEVEATAGPEDAAETWDAVYQGRIAPSVGQITSLHAPS